MTFYVTIYMAGLYTRKECYPNDDVEEFLFQELSWDKCSSTTVENNGRQQKDSSSVKN